MQSSKLSRQTQKQSRKAARGTGRWQVADAPEAQSMPARTGPRRGWLLMILVALLAGGGTWAFFEYVVWNRVPAALVGQWVVTEGPREYTDATFEFSRNGTLVAKLNVNGREGITNATIRVEGNTIFSTSKRPSTGEETTHTLTIRTLTDSEFVVEDEQGKVMKMKRAATP